MTDSSGDYWTSTAEPFTEKLMEEHVLAGRTDREWGDLFCRPDDDPLLGEWEVHEREARQLEAHLGISLDL